MRPFFRKNICYPNKHNQLRKILKKQELYLLKHPNWAKKIFKNFNEKIIPFFNRYSNNYGLSPLRGILFTLGIGMIFYLGYLFPIEAEFSCEYYIKFLNPVHSFVFMDVCKPDGAYAIDGLSRVFITYGYYQTFQAFRKYKRI